MLTNMNRKRQLLKQKKLYIHEERLKRGIIMSVQITRNINISGCGMPMMPMAPMMPMGGCCPGMGMSVFCRPMMGCGMTNAMAAGACIGAALATPGVLDAIGSGIQWGYNNLIKPVVNFAGKALKWGYNNIIQPAWNNYIKPALGWVYNSVLKPAWNNYIKPTLGLIGQGLQWIWDHTLGWIIKKVGKKSEGTPKAQGETTQAAESTTAQTVEETAEAEA